MRGDWIGSAFGPRCLRLIGCLAIFGIASDAGAAGVVSSGSLRSQAGSFHVLGNGAGLWGPQIHGLSGDGQVFVGSDAFGRGFRYSIDDGVLLLPSLPGGVNVIAESASQDGSAIVGAAHNAATRWEAFRYTSSGIQGLGMLSGTSGSSATAVSNDGAVVVGFSDSLPFRWTQGSGMTQLSGALGYAGWAWDVSGDGGVVVGNFISIAGTFAFRWTEAEGMVSLGVPPGHERSDASAISADGSTIVGTSRDDDTGESEAFRWTQREGLVPLGVVSSAVDVSADGRVIVGRALAFDDEMSPVAVAFVWTAENGMVQLRDYLTMHGLPGDQLPVLEPVLRGVSHAGRVLAGTEDSAMSTGSFVVELGVPLPALGGSAWVLLGIVLGVVGLRAVGESRRPRSRSPQ